MLLPVKTQTFTSCAQGRPLLQENRQLQRHRKFVNTLLSASYYGWAETTKRLFSLRSQRSNIFIQGRTGSFSQRQSAQISKMQPYYQSRMSRYSFFMFMRMGQIQGRSRQFQHRHRQYPLFLAAQEFRVMSRRTIARTSRLVDFIKEGSVFFHFFRTTIPTRSYCLTLPFVKICLIRLRKCLVAEKRKVRPMNQSVSIIGKIIFGASETILLKMVMVLGLASTLRKRDLHLTLKSFLVFERMIY